MNDGRVLVGKVVKMTIGCCVGVTPLVAFGGRRVVAKTWRAKKSSMGFLLSTIRIG